MELRRNVLWVSDDIAPPNVSQAVLDGPWSLSPYRRDLSLEEQLDSARIAMIYPNGQSEDPLLLGALLGTLERTSAVAVLVLPEKATKAWAAVHGRAGQFLCVGSHASSEHVAAQLAAAAALQPTIQNLRAELEAARKLAKSPTGQVSTMDEELRLAARLQREFLPSRLPEVGPARFGVLFRPASWLSGDLYDVVRLDESHVGFYVADAVGHGMPAALLTMFIKHALQTKQIVDNAYQIVPPEVSLSELNADICQQNLTSCQFCTAFYGVLDTTTLRLTYSRAGHPPPLLIHPDKSIELLDVPGSLLGVFPEEKFEAGQVMLTPGDRLMLYTDGAEEALRHAARKPGEDLANLVTPLLGLGRDEMLLQLTAWIDSAQDNPNGEDDVTVIVADIEA